MENYPEGTGVCPCQSRVPHVWPAAPARGYVRVGDCYEVLRVVASFLAVRAHCRLVGWSADQDRLWGLPGLGLGLGQYLVIHAVEWPSALAIRTLGTRSD